MVKNYANHYEVIKDISHYTKIFYNQIRLNSTLGYLSPSNCKQNIINDSIPKW